MYGRTNYGKLFADKLTYLLINEPGFKKSQCQMYIYYNYAPDGNIFVLSYVDDCVYWYTPEDNGKWFLDTIGNIFHMKFLVFSHLFMSIRISQLREHSISVDQTIYATDVLDKYIDTAILK